MKFNVNKIITESSPIITEETLDDDVLTSFYKNAKHAIGKKIADATGFNKEHEEAMRDVTKNYHKPDEIVDKVLKMKKSSGLQNEKLSDLELKKKGEVIQPEAYTPTPTPTPETDDYGPAAGLALVGGLGAYALSRKSKK